MIANAVTSIGVLKLLFMTMILDNQTISIYLLTFLSWTFKIYSIFYDQPFTAPTITPFTKCFCSIG